MCCAGHGMRKGGGGMQVPRLPPTCASAIQESSDSGGSCPAAASHSAALAGGGRAASTPAMAAAGPCITCGSRCVQPGRVDCQAGGCNGGGLAGQKECCTGLQWRGACRTEGVLHRAAMAGGLQDGRGAAQGCNGGGIAGRKGCCTGVQGVGRETQGTNTQRRPPPSQGVAGGGQAGQAGSQKGGKRNGGRGKGEKVGEGRGGGQGTCLLAGGIQVAAHEVVHGRLQQAAVLLAALQLPAEVTRALQAGPEGAPAGVVRQVDGQPPRRPHACRRGRMRPRRARPWRRRRLLRVLLLQRLRLVCACADDLQARGDFQTQLCGFEGGAAPGGEGVALGRRRARARQLRGHAATHAQRGGDQGGGGEVVHARGGAHFSLVPAARRVRGGRQRYLGRGSCLGRGSRGRGVGWGWGGPAQNAAVRWRPPSPRHAAARIGARAHL
jgi:hypothetical protein